MESSGLYTINTITLFDERMIIQKTRSKKRGSTPIQTSLVSLSPGIDQESYSRLISRDLRMHNLSCNDIKQQGELEYKESNYQILLANQTLDSWTRTCISQGDFVVFLTRGVNTTLEREQIERINSLPYKNGQQRWLCCVSSLG